MADNRGAKKLSFFDILLAKKLGGGGSTQKYDIKGEWVESENLGNSSIRLNIITPQGATQIVSSAFYGKTPIKKAVLTDIAIIGNYAFQGQEYLEEIEMPKVTSINSYAFNNCTSIKNIYLPNTISNIKQKAFAYTTSLENVYCMAINPPSITADAFNNSTIQNIYVPADKVNVYKSAGGWSNYASLIKAIPQ